MSKLEQLQTLLESYGSLLVAYSGGVDSAFLAWAAHRALGQRMLAVLADSPSLARSQMSDAVSFAREHGIALEIVDTRELQRPDYVRNDGLRCFHCKDELFGVMDALPQRSQFAHLAYGMNLDDRGDYRPGQRAALQHGVVAPLVEVGLGKEDVRALARAAGLRVWDKPAAACLASRVEHGSPVTAEVLATVEKGEEILFRLGFRQVRVRHHGATVRLEIAPDELERALTLPMFQTFTRTFKELGFTYVTVDTEGFRSGSMNAVLLESR